MSLSAGRPSKQVDEELALSDIAETKTNRVNFNLDENKHIELKKYALNNRKSVTEVLTELIDEYVIER